MKRGFSRLFILLFSAASLLFGISSCGFVGALFGGGGDDGWGASDYYTLTINYNYWGTATVSADNPIVFWIMPLDENGNIIDDAGSPDSGPAREVEEAYIPNGSLSITLATGTYAILAFHDSVYKNDAPDLQEPYVLYNDRYFADSTVTPYTDSNGTPQYFVNPHWDTIALSDHDENIYLGFGNEGQKYEWHSVYIAQPDDGEYILEGNFPDGFFVAGGLFGDQGTSLQVEVDGIPIAGGVVTNNTGDMWYAHLNVHDYPNNVTHSLRVRAFSQSGEQYDSYAIGFIERNWMSPPVVYITAPYENQYLLNRLDLTGKYDPGKIKYIEVYIDGLYKDTANLYKDNGSWDFSIDTSSLSPDGFHFINVDAYDFSSSFIDTYIVNFIEADGKYAYIGFPSDGQSYSFDFPVGGNFDVDSVKYIQIQIDSGEPLDAGTIDFSSGYWDALAPAGLLSTGLHTLTVYAVDQYYNVLSTDQITFNKT